ncbi:hypothetical protein [Dyadobacter frigoris]|uniref:Uncharacterized protein n=1 Tax=Dyadobacter frigoris TaxID=2576211 RepID=A0A4U6CXC9_9BACT|nr:hypothetical protein [Dyadobacter frigoris]TKT89490.1 hypothetical protein FDK13_24415 [Dyadobacter frigoris]
MIYRPQTINFREVYRGDTFHLTDFIVSSNYEIKPTTDILMQIRPTGDIPEMPVLTFSTEENGGITIAGQTLTFHKETSEMQLVRSGRFEYDMEFTTDNIKTTLYKGLFEIMQDDSKTS